MVGAQSASRGSLSPVVKEFVKYHEAIIVLTPLPPPEADSLFFW
jgi:hypothetical protein